MFIRKVIAADAADIAELSGQLGYKMSVAKTAEQINAVNGSINDIAFVAVDNNKIVGWIHVFYTIRLECDSYCEIGGLVIDEQHRGKGIGKILIEHIKSWCADKKCTTLRVRSNVKRTEAHKFYEHLGFTQTKQQSIFNLEL